MKYAEVIKFIFCHSMCKLSTQGEYAIGSTIPVPDLALAVQMQTPDA